MIAGLPAVTHGDLTVQPVYADSMGAKTTCCYVETPELSVCIDPGVAGMQPSFPLPDAEKRTRVREARTAIDAAVAAADHVVVSHYHYDHYAPDPAGYRGTDLWLKDPNRWINDSQWDRARSFLAALAADRGESLVETPPRRTRFEDPIESLPHAAGTEFGDYQPRREELLAQWRERYERRVARWASEPWVEPPSGVRFADGRSFERGDTRVRFHGPLFHGVEYAATGWVVATVVETPSATFVHSSDLEGPTIEDYADWLIAEDPDLVFLDGPSTYLLGFLLNRVNLDRAVENARRIVTAVDPALLLWDHHLLRDVRYRERTEAVWALREDGYSVSTVAEVHGQAPLADELRRA